MNLNPMLVGKVSGGLVFVASIGVNAAQSWMDPGFVLPAAVRFALFVAAAVLGGAQLMLPRPGEPASSNATPPAERSPAA